MPGKATFQGMTAEHNDTSELSTPKQRQERVALGTRFLDDVLLVGIGRGTITTSEHIVEAFRNFQRENPGPGNDFELGHSWQIAFERDMRNDCLAQTALSRVPRDAQNIKVAVNLLAAVVFADDQSEDTE